MSSWPRWTPSAPDRRAMSGRSLTIKRPPAACTRATKASASASLSADEPDLSRSWMKRAPPARNASSTARGSSARSRHSVTSRMGYRRSKVQGHDDTGALRQEQNVAAARALCRFREASRRRLLLDHVALHERGAETAGHEVGIREDLQVQRNRGLDPLDDGHLERPPHARDRLLAIAAVHD